MAGPLIERAKEALGIEDEPPVRKRLDSGRPLKEHQEKLNDKIDDGGGCCDAAMAAEATRRDGKEYR